jgi:AbrB family looped-hinge helix DNA binding protein
MPTSLKLSRVQRKGQVTIPQEIRLRLGLQEGDLVAFVETDQGVVITPQKVVPAEMLDKLDRVMRGEKNKQAKSQ